ncbi:MAG: aspartate-semialdehyde dehydrogenase [Candidatus Omnitrophota bacterium]|jgi:aspartate-semialdehyde dehydrogenase
MASKKQASVVNVAIMGATGAVGKELLKILAQRKFPIGELRLLASKRSVGKKLKFKNKFYTVQELKTNSFEGIDIVLSSAGGSLSKKFVPYAVKAGAVVVDNTSAYRMDPKVPLVVPEINAAEIKKHKGIIANPNCSTIIMLLPLWPIDKQNKIKKISVATYQAASGAGAVAMQELEDQSKQVLSGKKAVKKVFPHQIAFNVFSHNSPICANGFNEEELKMVHETHKIFKRKNIQIDVTCVRVPVYRAHSEAIFIELTKPMTPAKARSLIKAASGIQIVDDVKQNYFPMPLEADGGDDVLVGRIRQGLDSKKSLGMFISGDQIRKGAALNAVQIAEYLV